MRFAVYGAGAVGCYFGGMLARAGHDVVLIGRSRHAAAISRRGLRFQAATFDEIVHAQASTDIAAAALADVVFVCTKSTGTAEAAKALSQVLSCDARVVSLQNGIENASRLRQQLSQPVIAAAVYVAAEMADDGHVLHHGRGDLVLEDCPGARSLVATLRQADIPVELSLDVQRALWQKLTLNCAYNAISAITMRSLDLMPERDALRDTMRDVVAECFAVAAAENVIVADDVEGFVQHIEHTIPSGQLSSTAQDLGRGKTSEIEYLNGTILRRGTEYGIPTPANRMLYTLVKMLEAKAAVED